MENNLELKDREIVGLNDLLNALKDVIIVYNYIKRLRFYYIRLRIMYLIWRLSVQC